MSPTSPEQWIRGYLLENAGRASVPVHNLLTTWRLQRLDAEALGVIGGGLAAAGITVDPPLTLGTRTSSAVTLYVAVPAQPEPPPQASPQRQPEPSPAAPPDSPPERIRLRPRGAPSTPATAPAPAPRPVPPPAERGRVADRQRAEEAPQTLRRRPPRPEPRMPPAGPPPDRFAAPPPDRLGGPPPSRLGGAWPSSGYAPPSEPVAPPAPVYPGNRTPAPENVGPFGGLTLRRDLNRLRHFHEGELRALGSLLFELYRVGSDRPELVRERMAELQASSDQILRTEEALGLSTGGVCPGCGLYCSDSRVCLACGREIHAPASAGITRRMSLPVVLVGVVMLTAAWLFGGLGSGHDDPAQRRATAAVPVQKRFPSVAAQVRGPRIGVYRSPAARQPSRTLSNPNIDGAELVFLIKRIRGDRAYVYLPTRPNGSMGWIKLSDVSLAGHDYRVTIDLGKRTIKAWKGSREIANDRVGVGRAVTPTPTGRYYITELLKQPDPGGDYGPFAFGLSVHSDVLFEFAGADGILGIHGTNEPAAIGTDVSHGCIRVYNRVIRKLAKTLPVGTPVRIVRS